MGALFDKHVRLFDGLVYEKDAYDKRPGCDPDIICRGIEPVTDIERRGMERLSSVDFELLQHKMSAITEEARDIYMNLSISEGIITADMNCGIFTASGDPVIVGTGIYFHTLLNNAQLKYINKYYRNDPSVGLTDGDIYFFNDELAGGIHNFDMFTAMPVFWEGELVAWVECGGHQGETGSITPGGFAPTAKSRYDEGLHVPCMRIGSNFLLHRDTLDFLANSVRNGFVLEADIRSRVAVMMQMRKGILREIERKGVEYVVGGMRQILANGERNARTRLRQINDGVFRSILFNDDHGTFTGLTRIPLTLIKEDDELCVIIQGASPECPTGPFNCTWHLARAGTAVYLFSYFFRGFMPANAGLLEPVKYYIEGPTLMNSTAEVAHGLGNQVASFATQNLFVAGAKMLFSSPHIESVQAPQSRNYSLPVYSGANRRGYMSMNYSGQINAGGGGARYDMDGENALGFYWGPWTDAGEVEEQDDRMPQLSLSRKLDKNFHGYGKFRGGTPLLEVCTFTDHQQCCMSSWGGSDKVSLNFGLFGGYAGPPNPRFVIRDTDLLAQIKAGEDVDLGQYQLLTERNVKGDYILSSSSKDAEEFDPGDLIVSSVGAGGGYGDVLDRDPELVLQDLEDGLITKDIAEGIYCVVIDPDTKLVDEAATKVRKDSVRQERLKNGQTFDKFIVDWMKQKPDEHILEHYGNWPEPHLPQYNKPFWGFYD
ncbi:MAG: hydantoinase B/oxoprolinase family protein [Pseudomonadota bacterium]